MIDSVKRILISRDKYILFIYFFIFLTPWNIVKSQVAISSVVLVIWGIIKYKEVVLEKIKIFYDFKPLLVLVGFILYCFIASLWSDPFVDGFKRVLNFHKYELLFGGALLVALNKEQAITALKVLILSFTGYSVFSILIYFDIVSVVGSSVDNPRGILRYSISTQYMVMSIFSGIIFAYYSKIKKEKIVFVVISLLSLFALFINDGRTSQVTFFLILLLFTIIFSMKNLKLAIGIFLITLLLVFTFAQNDKMSARFNLALNQVEQISKQNIYDGNFGLRLYFNKVGLGIIKENFIFGMGPADNRSELVRVEKEDENYKSPIIKHFHSEHMEILTAYGVVGYTLIVTAIGLLIYKLRDDDIHFYLSIGFFFTLFFVSFGNKTLSLKPLNYIYIIVFLLFSIIAYSNHANKQKSIEEL